MAFANIILPLPFQNTFLYSIGDLTISIGDVVSVEFGRKLYWGVVFGVVEEVEIKPDFQVKPIISASNFKFSCEIMKFLHFISSYNMIALGMVYKMAMSVPKVFKNPNIHHDYQKCLEHQDIILNDEQENAFNIIKSLLHHNKPIVLQGVTGSGKTEVYLKIVQEILRGGKQVLILLPEILLTTQLMQRFVQRLGHGVYQWHSELTTKQRSDVYWGVYSCQINVVVGPRSAIFLPFQDLGIIVVDEEHDASFKQEEQGCYNGRDAAVFRAKCHNIPIILSSATPSVESEYNVILQKYHKILLTNRYGNASMPELKIIDIASKKLKPKSWISDELTAEIQKALSIEKQVLIYMNRRGYSMVSLCKECNSKIVCPNCEFNLVKHKNKDIMLCHYCNYHEKPDLPCKSCGAKEKFSDIGPGIERIAEEILQLFPTARMMILSSDTLKKSSVVIKKIINHEVDIIVGTQIISKGLHFPKLDLVGILDADMGLMTGDIRAYEKTFQAIKQVSGRAGRDSGKGLVCLQTLNAKSYLITALEQDNWDEFIRNELLNRKKANMPPFSRLILITMSHNDQKAVFQAANSLLHHKPSIAGFEILGPTQSPIYMLRNKFRYRYVIIADKKVDFAKIIAKWLVVANIKKSVNMKIDIDPISFT